MTVFHILKRLYAKRPVEVLVGGFCLGGVLAQTSKWIQTVQTHTE